MISLYLYTSRPLANVICEVWRKELYNFVVYKPWYSFTIKQCHKAKVHMQLHMAMK